MLTVRRRDTTDQILASSAQDRQRRRASEAMDEDRPRSPRSRSTSGSSVSSVSTISTKSADSRSARRQAGARVSHAEGPSVRYNTEERYSGQVHNGAKRRRRTSSVSEDSLTARAAVDVEHGRNTRRRKRSSSPAERGRRPDRHVERDHGSTHAMDQVPARGPERDTNGMTREKLHRDENQSARERPPNRNGNGQERRRIQSLSPYSKRVALSQAVNPNG